MVEAYVLLTTKLGVQARSRRYLARPRLRTVLDGAPEARLVLLSAPAGFGKTALLTDWLADGRKRVAWISLDRADNDPAHFLRYLREAARALNTEHRPDATPSRFAAPPDRDLVLGDLLSGFEARPDPGLLVLDDYHVVEAPAIHSIVETIIERLPANARLVIATRADPPLPVARLRARGELLEIRADALCFTRDEAGDFLRGSMDLDLAPELVDVLSNRTEGWAAALQLAALSLRNRSDADRLVREFGAANRFLLDFVIEEVLANQPHEIEEFLIRTCVLDRLTGPLCDELTGRHDGAETLDRLERSNMLVFPLDESRCWYRYHQLFAELLQARLAMRDPQLAFALHRQAAAWYEAQGLASDAIEHGLRAGDTDDVRRLIRRHWTAVMHGGELWTVQRWLDALPDEVVRHDPQLCVTYAFGLALRGGTAGVVERLVDARDALEGEPCEPLDRLLVPPQIELIEALLAEIRGDPSADIEHARAAIDLIPPGILPEADAVLRGDALNLIGEAHLLTGDDERAAEAFREALPLLRRVGNTIAVAHGALHLVRIEIRRGNVASALELCAELLPADDASGPVAAAALHLARAEALEALGDREAARESAFHAVRLSHDSGDGSVLRDARTCLERIARFTPGQDFGLRGCSSSQALVEPLTPREIEVLRLVAAGRTNRQIAAELFVALGTAKAHVHSICAKLGASNRVGAIVRGRELGLLD